LLAGAIAWPERWVEVTRRAPEERRVQWRMTLRVFAVRVLGWA